MSKKHFIALADVMRECYDSSRVPCCILPRCCPPGLSFGTNSSYILHPLGSNLPPGSREMDVESQGVLLQHIANFCSDQNGRFDRNRWFDYIAGKCGPSGGAVKK